MLVSQGKVKGEEEHSKRENQVRLSSGPVEGLRGMWTKLWWGRVKIACFVKGFGF